jgi:hypothetical protein
MFRHIRLNPTGQTCSMGLGSPSRSSICHNGDMRTACYHTGGSGRHAGRWSMVVAIRSRSMGSEAREETVRCSARIRCCRGIGWGAGQLASVLVTRTMGTWGLGRRSIGRGLDGLVVYPGRRLDFAGNAYPALTRMPFGKENCLAYLVISSVISTWWAHKVSNLGPAD